MICVPTPLPPILRHDRVDQHDGIRLSFIVDMGGDPVDHEFETVADVVDDVA